MFVYICLLCKNDERNCKNKETRFLSCDKELIFRFAKEVESIFAEAMVVQFSTSSWVICMTVYKIVGVSLFIIHFLRRTHSNKHFLHVVFVTVEFFINGICFDGCLLDVYVGATFYLLLLWNRTYRTSKLKTSS